MKKYYIVLTPIKVGLGAKGQPAIIEIGTAVPLDESEAAPLLSCKAIREADDIEAGEAKLYAAAELYSGNVDGAQLPGGAIAGNEPGSFESASGEKVAAKSDNAESNSGATAGNESGSSESAGDEKVVTKPAGKK